MVTLRLPRVLLATVVAGSLVAACQPARPNTPTTSPNPVEVSPAADDPRPQQPDQDGLIVVSENTHYTDAFEAGVLSKSDLIDPSSPITDEWGVTVSNNGVLWYDLIDREPAYLDDGTRSEADRLIPRQSIEFDPITGENQDWALNLFQGKADPTSGDAGYGLISASDNHVIWAPRRETRVLDLEDNEIWVAERSGAKPRKIGEGTIDAEIDGEEVNFSVYGAGSAPLIVGDRGYWVESTSLKGSTPEHPKTGMSIFSAPIDGSEPMKETIPGGWVMEADLCAPADSPSFTYVVSSTSTGNTAQNSEVRRRTFNAKGLMVSDEQIWQAPESHDMPDSVNACGDVLAVGRYVLGTDKNEPDASRSKLDIVRNGKTVTLVWEEIDTGIGNVRATPYGVFFVDAIQGGFYYDLERSELFHIGEGGQMRNDTPGYRADGQKTIILFGTEKDPEYNSAHVWSSYKPIIVTHNPAQ